MAAKRIKRKLVIVKTYKRGEEGHETNSICIKSPDDLLGKSAKNTLVPIPGGFQIWKENWLWKEILCT